MLFGLNMTKNICLERHMSPLALFSPAFCFKTALLLELFWTRLLEGSLVRHCKEPIPSFYFNISTPSSLFSSAPLPTPDLNKAPGTLTLHSSKPYLGFNGELSLPTPKRPYFPLRSCSNLCTYLSYLAFSIFNIYFLRKKRGPRHAD